MSEPRKPTGGVEEAAGLLEPRPHDGQQGVVCGRLRGQLQGAAGLAHAPHRPQHLLAVAAGALPHKLLDCRGVPCRDKFMLSAPHTHVEPLRLTHQACQPCPEAEVWRRCLLPSIAMGMTASEA